MSLGDYLRLLRGRRRGITPWEIEAATGLTKGLYRQMEQRYRAVGDDATIQALADFYGVPFETLRWRLDWPRKALSRALLAAQQANAPCHPEPLERSDGLRPREVVGPGRDRRGDRGWRLDRGSAPRG